MKLYQLLATVVGLTGVVGVASAQTKDVEKPFRVQVGSFMPSKAALKSAVGKNWTSFGVAYELQKKKGVEKPLIYGVYVDYATKKRGGVSNNLTGIGAQARYLLGSPTDHDHAYVIGGIGSYTFKRTGSSYKSKIGFKAGGGYEMNNGLYGEVTAVSPGNNANGVNLSVGFRF